MIKIVRHFSQVLKDKNVKTNSQRGELFNFICGNFQNQKLSISLVGSSKKSYELIDDLIIDINQLVVDRQYGTRKLSNMIDELTNLLSIENNIKKIWIYR